jgi:hypothetical protein
MRLIRQFTNHSNVFSNLSSFLFIFCLVIPAPSVIKFYTAKKDEFTRNEEGKGVLDVTDWFPETQDVLVSRIKDQFAIQTWFTERSTAVKSPEKFDAITDKRTLSELIKLVYFLLFAVSFEFDVWLLPLQRITSTQSDPPIRNRPALAARLLACAISPRKFRSMDQCCTSTKMSVPIVRRLSLFSTTRAFS